MILTNYGNLYRTKTFCVLIQRGLGDPRVVLRAANLKWSIAGGNRSLIPRRLDREIEFPPWSASLVTFLPKQESYPPEAPAQPVLNQV